MTEQWKLPTGPMKVDFGAWVSLHEVWVSLHDKRDPGEREAGLYLIRSRHLAHKSGWPSPSDSRTAWRQDGVIYVGASLDLGRRVREFVATVNPEQRSLHSGARRFRELRVLPLYADVRDTWVNDLELSFALLPSTPPPGVDVRHRRWASAHLRSLEAIESSIIADIQAYRVACGCKWVLVNYVDWSLYKKEE